jgi:hypothetical protein
MTQRKFIESNSSKIKTNKGNKNGINRNQFKMMCKLRRSMLLRDKRKIRRAVSIRMARKMNR